jgi:hypothetical protein
MKRDIRDLFKEESNFKTLPENHKADFAAKLTMSTVTKKPSFLWFKIAGVLILLLSIGFSFLFTNKSEESTSILIQIETVEAEYLKNINAEWSSFIKIADDESLVKRYKQKMNDLQLDYDAIAYRFKEEPNNIEVLEALIENLQTRLKLLKDIQAHIKILNQKNLNDEHTI